MIYLTIIAVAAIVLLLGWCLLVQATRAIHKDFNKCFVQTVNWNASSKMTLSEAIKHARDVSLKDDLCEACRADHKQLAIWLEKLQEAEELLDVCYKKLLDLDERDAKKVAKQIDKWRKTYDEN